MRLAWFLLIAGAAVLPGQKLPVHVAGGLGYATFIDESDQSHVTGGASARFYFTRRNAIEPEVMYLYRDAADRDVILGMNHVRDWGGLEGARRRMRWAESNFCGGCGRDLRRLRVR